MGFKRPFEAEEFGEYPFKYSRQLPPHNQLPPKQERVVDNNGGYKPQGNNKSFGNDDPFYENLFYDGKSFEARARAPVPCVTRSSSDELSDSGEKSPSSVSREYFKLEVPRRSFASVEDDAYAYPLHLDRSPRKQVSVGPNHQANVPSWGEQVKEEKLARSDQEKLMGTCIIPMPDSDSFRDEKTITDCICLDRGSIRCVRQHVSKAKENLLKTIGYEKFVNLGLCEMGEEIVHDWSEEEEDLFHQIVYSNPVSLNRNFWNHLASEFPFRSRKEIVSYYFNVFMLRKRASQNRSNFLDIDSDDDEWRGSLVGPFQVCGSDDEDEDDEDEDRDNRFDSRKRQNMFLDNDEEENEDEDEDEDDDSDDDDDDDVDAYPTFGCVDMKVSCDDVIEQDDSCISFELQSNKVSADALKNKTRESNGGNKIDLNKFDGCDDEDDMYMLDSSYDDAANKVWDFKYGTDSVNGFDLQPTFNIIEEIFGEGTWDDEHGKKYN